VREVPVITTDEKERTLVLAFHERIEQHYDLDRWHWTDETTAYDVVLGAILVQHTAWTNVERAMARLREAGISSFESVHELPKDELAALVWPAGTPRTKAERLQAFAALASQYDGLAGLLKLAPNELRETFLATPGIGPETADVILLYGARHPVIVHDAYTARLYGRIGIGPASKRYGVWQAWLDALLPRDAAYRRRHHAGITVHSKETCRARPKCGVCPLREMCAVGRGEVGL
jgi:endonuclease-3 related protein